MPLDRLTTIIVVLAALAMSPALAQQSAPPPAQAPASPPAPQQQPAPQSTAAAPLPQNPAWSNLPKMILERQFSGPLQDTIIQRWRDPVDNSICYIYLPITAPHSPTTASGFVQYGSVAIGSISCMPGSAGRGSAPPAAPARKQ